MDSSSASSSGDGSGGVNVLIAFYSRDGHVEALAKAMAEGAASEGATVRLRRARELVGPEVMAKAPGWAEKAQHMNEQYEAPKGDDAVWADAILFGTPTRFGSICSELKAYIDSLGGLWFQGKLNGKVGGAFSSTASLHGGNESTIIGMYNFMAHLGMILVPLGYTDQIMFKAGTPYGATTTAGDGSRVVTEEELSVARHQGKRTAQVARALKAANITVSK
eukprot:TRINITY_DN3369_c0_g1_i1.p1 TRINITY_DN3369_c0_g1~~TRINITY_DN3369_c0_g1_i1.p1  ORF type:complete len:221 (+),score=61.08 TRINITY_DN3369_c0_g1_i1:164-826(+)